MGCDIHCFIEKRLDPTHKWELDEGHKLLQEEEYSYLEKVSATDRDYDLFAILANVRGDGALYPRRGIPDDICERLQDEVMGSDWHSHSHLSLDEFKECVRFVGYDLSSSKNATAFYDYRDYADYKSRPPAYIAMINYCEKWLEEQRKDQLSIIEQLRLAPEVRIVFFFDN